MDIKELPRDPLERRAKILTEDLGDLINTSLSFINGEYDERKLLEGCARFAERDIFDSSRADSESLFERVGFFPVLEASRELGEALNRAFETAYKSVYDHLRRAIELTIVGVYFTSRNISAKDAREWILSRKHTPFFSRIRKEILEDNRFSRLDKACAWSLKVKHFFDSLSDIIHVRGSKYSFDRFHPSIGYISGTAILSFSSESLKNVLDTYILTVRHMSTIIAASNPILLVGLPLDEKFGINTPISGFYYPDQATRLWELLLDDTKDFFSDLVETDQEVIGIKTWIDGIKNISKEELNRQMKDLKLRLNRND